MRIVIQTIPHKAQRYPTAGDWQFREAGRELLISVSETGNHRSNLLVALHELIEALLCDDAMIDQADVDAFDMTHLDLDEPGAHPDAPYHDQHNLAEGIERIMAGALGISWCEHEDNIASLDKR
jgi:hypothetical protein